MNKQAAKCRFCPPHCEACRGPGLCGCHELVDGHGQLREGGFDEAGVASVERKMTEAAAMLSDHARYTVMRDAGSKHPCQIQGCSLSQEEHHRLAYGILAENRELRRRVEALEHGDAARAVVAADPTDTGR